MNMFRLFPARASPKTPKGEGSRERILDAAISLSTEVGYPAATMRAIAARAGVSLGSAYYYFASKEHLVQGFYGRCQRDHRAACAGILAGTPELRDRLRGVLLAWQDLIDPYHAFAGALFRTAADPGSPLNPFSAESARVRDDAIALFAEVVDGSRTQVPADVRAFLPTLLWTFHMGIVLFWIHDASEGCRRTRLLIERGVDLVAGLLAIADLPELAALRGTAMRLLTDVLRLPTPTHRTQEGSP